MRSALACLSALGSESAEVAWPDAFLANPVELRDEPLGLPNRQVLSHPLDDAEAGCERAHDL